MGYQRNSMTFNFEHKEGFVQFVADHLQTFPSASPWTMTITRGRLGDYSVRSVIEESSEGTDEITEAEFFSRTQVNT